MPRAVPKKPKRKPGREAETLKIDLPLAEGLRRLVRTVRVPERPKPKKLR
jgi:hypothetical protein